jgi:hypothetical protein
MTFFPNATNMKFEGCTFNDIAGDQVNINNVQVKHRYAVNSLVSFSMPDYRIAFHTLTVHLGTQP